MAIDITAYFENVVVTFIIIITFLILILIFLYMMYGKEEATGTTAPAPKTKIGAKL